MILSLDVGFRNTGYAIFTLDNKLVDFGVIKTQKNKKKQKKIIHEHFDNSKYIASALREIIKNNNIKVIIGEIPNGGAQSAAAMSSMNMSAAIIAVCCELLQIPSDFTDPASVKFVMTGKKNASKKEVMDAVKEKYPKADFPKAKGTFEHIADAIAAYHVLKNCDIIRLLKVNCHAL